MEATILIWIMDGLGMVVSLILGFLVWLLYKANQASLQHCEDLYREGKTAEAVRRTLEGMYEHGQAEIFAMPMHLRRSLNEQRDRLAMVARFGQSYGRAWHRQLADLEAAVEMFSEALHDKNTEATDDTEVWRKGSEALALYIVAREGLLRMTDFEMTRSNTKIPPDFKWQKIDGID